MQKEKVYGLKYTGDIYGLSPDTVRQLMKQIMVSVMGGAEKVWRHRADPYKLLVSVPADTVRDMQEKIDKHMPALLWLGKCGLLLPAFEYLQYHKLHPPAGVSASRLIISALAKSPIFLS